MVGCHVGSFGIFSLSKVACLLCLIFDPSGYVENEGYVYVNLQEKEKMMDQISDLFEAFSEHEVQ